MNNKFNDGGNALPKILYHFLSQDNIRIVGGGDIFPKACLSFVKAIMPFHREE